MVKNKRIMGMLAFLFAVCLPAVSVQAEEEPLLFSNFVQGGEEGGTIFIECSSDRTQLRMEYQFEDEGYHTVTAFRNSREVLPEEGSLTFHVENSSKVPARISVQMVERSGDVKTVANGYYVLLEDAKEKAAPVENDCFILPAGYSGKVEIPLQLFWGEEEMAERIIRYGIVCVAEGTEQYCLTFSDMWLQEEGTDPEEPALLKIEGADSVQKGSVGESREYYRSMAWNLFGEEKEVSASFGLKEEWEQVTMQAEGCLSVWSGAEPEEIILTAETKEGLQAEKAVEIVLPWAESAAAEEGNQLSIAAPEEIAPITGWLDFLTEENNLWIVRGIALGASLLLLLYYHIVRRRKGGEQ